MKKINWPIIIGLIIISIMILVMVYEESIIRVDPLSIDEDVSYDLGDEKLSITHPLPPNKLDKFGTDPIGRNVHSLIITGTKVTIGIAVLASLFRLLIAVPIAFHCGFGGEVSRRFIKFFTTFFNIIPEIIVGYVILSQQIFKEVSIRAGILSTSITLAIIGWGRLARSLSDEIEKNIKKEKEKSNVSRKYIFKKIFPKTFASFFIEAGKALTSLCILGIIGITVGINKFNNIGFNSGISSISNYYPEWTGMLNIAREAIVDGEYWLVLFPLLGFTLSGIGFNLVGEGILYEVEKDYAIFYKGMKSIGHYISPKTYINEWKNAGYNMKNIIIKSFVIFIVVALIVFPGHKSVENIHKINGDNIVKYVEELTKDKYSGRAMGTEGIEEARNFIEKELDAMNLEPIFEEEGKEETLSFTKEYGFYTEDGKIIEGKNIAGCIRGSKQRYPLIIVTNYDYINNVENGEYKGLYESGTSIGATLELARALKEESLEKMPKRTIIFLFNNGSKYDGVGAYEAIGERYIDISSFYMYSNYLGVGDSDKLYLNTSTVSSGNAIFYEYVKDTKNIIRDNGFNLEYEYFGDMFEVPNTFFKNRVSGLTFSGINKNEYLNNYCGEKQNDINNINFGKLTKQTETLMEIAISYAWKSSYIWGN